MFVTEDGPMTFCLRPCVGKKRIKNIILKNGGKCVPNKFMLAEDKRKSVIMLVPEEKIGFEGDGYHTNFILECEKQGKLLPLQNFKIRMKVSSPKKGRNEYTEEEDQAIQMLVTQNKTGLAVTGNKFWKIAATEDCFKERGRTWQSLRDRFLRRLQKKTQNEKADTIEEGSISETSQEFTTELQPTEKTLSHGSDADKEEEEQKIAEYLSNIAEVDKPRAYKCLFKFNGNVDAAKYFIKHGICQKGYFLLPDKEDKLIIKSLMGNVDGKDNMELLRKTYGEKFIKERCICLWKVEENDLDILRGIDLDKFKK